MLTLSALQTQILVGGLLGDMSILRPKPSHNSRLAVRHSTDQTAYTMYLFSVFKNLGTATLVPKIGAYFDIRTGKTYYNISFYTRSLPCFNVYRELFYPLGVKIVPLCIGNLLTELGLAIWLMDDGYKDGNSFRIATESFTKEEVLLLISVLKTKFNLDCSINTVKGHQYRIYVQTHSMPHLRSLVTPYFIPEMMYKLK